MTTEPRFHYRPLSEGRIQRKRSDIEGDDYSWCASAINQELAEEICDALNGADDPITQLRETLAVLDQVHERLHALKAESVSDETQRQAARLLRDLSDTAQSGT